MELHAHAAMAQNRQEALEYVVNAESHSQMMHLEAMHLQMAVEQQRSTLQAEAHAAITEAAHEEGASRAEAARLRDVVERQREEVQQGIAQEAQIRSEARTAFADAGREVHASRAEALRLRTMVEEQRHGMNRDFNARLREVEIQSGRARAQLEEQRNQERSRAQGLEEEVARLRAQLLERNSIATDSARRVHFAPIAPQTERVFAPAPVERGYAPATERVFAPAGVYTESVEVPRRVLPAPPFHCRKSAVSRHRAGNRADQLMHPAPYPNEPRYEHTTVKYVKLP